MRGTDMPILGARPKNGTPAGVRRESNALPALRRALAAAMLLRVFATGLI